MATIEKHGSGYRARINVKVDGKYKRINKSGFKTKSMAKSWVIEQEALMAKGVNVESKRMLFSDYYDQWYKRYKTDTSSATRRWYERTSDIIDEYLPGVTLNELTRPVMQDMFNELGRHYSIETTNKIKSHVKQCIQNAIYDEIIYKDPTNGLIITGKGGKSKQLKFLEEHQMKSLIKHIQTISLETRSISDEMILTALNTGARYEEIAALTWNDLEGNSISINKAWEEKDKLIKDTKTEASNRIVDVPTDFITELTTWHPEHRQTDFIFSENGYVPISSRAVNKQLTRDLKAIHSPKMITFHGLRHTHASWLISKGIDIQYVSERLGHASVSMTLRVYTHLLDHTRKSETQKSVQMLNTFNN